MTEDYQLDTRLADLARLEQEVAPCSIETVWTALSHQRRRREIRRRRRMVVASSTFFLFVGLGLGRLSMVPPTNLPSENPVISTVSPWDPIMADLRVRSLSLLDQVSAAEATAAGAWLHEAPDLLWATRRLLDSPVVEQLGHRRLLTDLELVLAQLLEISDELDPTELALTQDAIRELDVLRQLRASTPVEASL